MAFLMHSVWVVGLAYVGVDGIGTKSVLWGCGSWRESLGVILWCGIVTLLVAGLVLWQALDPALLLDGKRVGEYLPICVLRVELG
jgi:hypothetical protein